MTDLVGQTVGSKYKIRNALGHGGMAEVYSAFQVGLDRMVAIKVVHSFLARDPNFLARFQREAQAVAELRHPNIVQVHDFNVHSGRPYMVLEYIDGVTLGSAMDSRMRENRALDLSETIWLMQGLCSAVNYAHSQEIVHRDITPSNVMLTTDGRVVLTDFGLARIIGGMKLTATGQITGTPEYMSPEQAHGQPGDQRSDIYALGIVLYECLTGNAPFKGDSPVSVLLKHVENPIPLVRNIRDDLPAPFDQIIAKGLAKDPEQRYQTGEELWVALRGAVSKDVLFAAKSQ
jgi:serine/threonine-protein kinase